MTLSPRTSFLKFDGKAYMEIADSPVFHRALEVALSEMHLSPVKGLDPAACWNQLEGAKRLLQILLDMGEPEPMRIKGHPRDTLQSPVNS